MTDNTKIETPQDIAMRDPKSFNPDEFCGWCGEKIEDCRSAKAGQVYGEECDPTGDMRAKE